MSWFDQNAPTGGGSQLQSQTVLARNAASLASGSPFSGLSQAPLAGRAPYNPNLPLDQQPGYPGWTPQPGQTANSPGGIIPTPPGTPIPPELAALQPGGGTAGTLPSDPQQAFLAAAAALGIPPNQTRGRSTEIVKYLTEHGQPGWQAGGTQADDWVKTPQGQDIDYSAAGSNAFQWNNDNTGSSMGALGGGMYQGGPFSMPSASEFQQSPGYQFARDQGLQAVERSAAARGTLLTGGTLKALSQYGTGVANQDYNNYFNRAYQTNQGNFNNQFSLANLGATTARNG